MIKIKRYYTAFRRYKRSKGFGIHSPFAFNFVLKVLRERCPYYAYDYIDAKRHEAQQLMSNSKERRGLISYKCAKMMFRVACNFSPRVMLQIGTSHGVSSISLLSVDSSSKLYSYTGTKHQASIFDAVTHDFNRRISNFDDISKAVNTYIGSLNDNDTPFMVINNIDKECEIVIYSTLDIVEKGGIVIVNNINHDKAINAMWLDLKKNMINGMSFSNYKMGIIVGKQHLPLQHFSLWF